MRNVIKVNVILLNVAAPLKHCHLLVIIGKNLRLAGPGYEHRIFSLISFISSHLTAQCDKQICGVS
jgi:hypothetical protein